MVNLSHLSPTPSRSPNSSQQRIVENRIVTARPQLTPYRTTKNVSECHFYTGCLSSRNHRRRKVEMLMPGYLGARVLQEGANVDDCSQPVPMHNVLQRACEFHGAMPIAAGRLSGLPEERRASLLQDRKDDGNKGQCLSLWMRQGVRTIHREMPHPLWMRKGLQSRLLREGQNAWIVW